MGAGKLTGAVFVAMTVLGSAAMADTCDKPAEQTAFQVRALQTDLMVAALTCQAKSDYNAFATKFQNVLVKNGKELKQHFLDTHGKGGVSKLNAYVTALANKASAKSIEARDGFCDDARRTFVSVLAMEPVDLEKFSVDRETTETASASCKGKVQVARKSN